MRLLAGMHAQVSVLQVKEVSPYPSNLETKDSFDVRNEYKRVNQIPRLIRPGC